MSECEHASRLSAYHDGELPAASAAQMEEHLRGCRACGVQLEQLRALSRMLREVKRPGLPQGALERLHRKLDLLPGAGMRRMAEAVAAVAASILVACCIGLATISGAGESAAAMASEDELLAVSQQDTATQATGGDEQLATWMIQELSGKNAHD